MKLAALNTPTIANSGAALVATSTTGLGVIVSRLVNGDSVHLVAIVAVFVGLAIGAALAYVGRPSTIPPAPK